MLDNVNVRHVIFLSTAEMGADYVSVSKDIIFNADTGNQRYILIPIINDECLEDDEEFTVVATSSMDCVNIIDGTVTITIDDDDCK